MTEKIIYTPQKNNETVLHKKERVRFFSFAALDAFADRVTHAFSTRKGGFSKGMFASMNLSTGSTDEKKNILFNYMEFAKAIGINYKNIVISDQKHTTNLRVVTAADRGKGLLKDRDYEAVDGFLTNEAGVALCLLFADCVPVYLYDPINEAIALVHSGWKGTVGQIAQKAIWQMEKAFGTKAADVIACIGPSICKDCYEVSSDLYDAFAKVYTPEEMQELFLAGKDAQHYQLDLWKAIQITLLKTGVKEAHIHVTDVCTCHNPDLLFSHRFTKGRRGNLAAVMMLQPEPKEDPDLFKNLLPQFLTKYCQVKILDKASAPKVR